MKKLLFIAAAFVTGFGAMAQQKADDVVKVNTEKYSFGKIQHNVPVTYEFEITNTSSKPIVIENATAGCGCTTPEVPKAPIEPNSTAKLKVEYNAATVAPFDKEVYVKFAGIAEPKVLRITGQVLNADAWNAYVKTDEYKKTQSAKKTGKMK
ncbi:MAG: DUF1573 domain-containing protein [Chitinophagaceae bacterium]